ncbi:MAG TPA: VWA domain-containing protein [Bryobacteraceae bacterium]|nr:VWA domain-containing protein [Bryobacteraceae bacterium]
MRIWRQIVAVLCLAFPLLGQDTTIRTTVPLAVLPASVTDRHGKSIEGLTAGDFVLLDDSRPKPVHVDVIDSGLPPIALVVLVQTSDRSLSALAKIREAGAMISEAVVGANGEAAVIAFDDEVRVLQDFTHDADAVSGAFRNLKPRDSSGARMIDAVESSLALLASRPGPRRSGILIVGESRDRGSKSKPADLQVSLERTGVTVYSMRYSAYLTPFTTRPEEYEPGGGTYLDGIKDLARLGKLNAMEMLTRTTGGLDLSFETKSKLEKNLMRLAGDIHNRYLVSFVPDVDETQRFHRLTLQIKNRPDAAVLTRPGYWSLVN